MRGLLEWLSEQAKVLAPVSAAIFALWRYLVGPRVVKPLLDRRKQRIAREERIDHMVEKVQLIHHAVGPNGGKSILDRVMHIQATVQVASARQALLADFMEQPLFEADAVGRFTRVNVAFERFSGYATAEVRDLGWKNFVQESDRARVATEWDHAIEDKRAFRCVFRFITKANLTHTVEMIARPAVTDSDQMVTTWMGVVGLVAADRSLA